MSLASCVAFKVQTRNAICFINSFICDFQLLICHCSPSLQMRFDSPLFNSTNNFTRRFWARPRTRNSFKFKFGRWFTYLIAYSVFRKVRAGPSKLQRKLQWVENTYLLLEQKQLEQFEWNRSNVYQLWKIEKLYWKMQDTEFPNICNLPDTAVLPGTKRFSRLINWVVVSWLDMQRE